MNPLLGPNPRPPGIGAGDSDDAQMGNGPDAGDLEQAPKPASPAGANPPAPASPTQQHADAAKAHFDQVSNAAEMLGIARSELDALTKLGDSATIEDVLKGAGKIIAEGGDPKQIMALIAGNPQGGQSAMPQGGQALASWLMEKDQMLKQQEQQLIPMQALAAHHMGVAGMHMLLADRIDDMRAKGQGSGLAGGPVGASPTASPNPLMSASSPSRSIN